MRIRYSIEIEASPSRIWEYLTTLEHQKKWMIGLVDIEPTSDIRHGVGATSLIRMNEGGNASVMESILTAYERPTHLALELRGRNAPAPMNVDYQLTDMGGRSTRLDYLMACELRGVAKALGFLFGWLARSQVANYLKGLKRLAEET